MLRLWWKSILKFQIRHGNELKLTKTASSLEAHEFNIISFPTLWMKNLTPASVDNRLKIQAPFFLLCWLSERPASPWRSASFAELLSRAACACRGWRSQQRHKLKERGESEIRGRGQRQVEAVGNVVKHVTLCHVMLWGGDPLTFSFHCHKDLWG